MTITAKFALSLVGAGVGTFLLLMWMTRRLPAPGSTQCMVCTEHYFPEFSSADQEHRYTFCSIGCQNNYFGMEA